MVLVHFLLEILNGDKYKYLKDVLCNLIYETKCCKRNYILYGILDTRYLWLVAGLLRLWNRLCEAGLGNLRLWIRL